MSDSSVLSPPPFYYHTGPLTADSIKHPALAFYAQYASNFVAHLASNSPYTAYYHPEMIQTDTDGTLIYGGATIWGSLKDLYNEFHQSGRILSIVVVVTAPETDLNGPEYVIHMEIEGTFLKKSSSSTTMGNQLDKSDDRGVTYPRMFIYTLGKEAEPGQGTMGMQFKGLRSFFDKGILERYRTSAH